MQAIPATTNDSPRRIWELRRASGDIFRCDLEHTPTGWMAWFSVNDQRLGGHRFEDRSPAIIWADTLLSAFRDLEQSAVG